MPSRLERFLSAPSLIEQGQFDRRTLTTVSEELENSLQQAIESYVGDRLRAIDEQLSRLHTEFNEALTRLRESSATGSLAATPLAELIAAHLQAARAQKLTEGAVPASEQSGAVSALKCGGVGIVGGGRRQGCGSDLRSTPGARAASKRKQNHRSSAPRCCRSRSSSRSRRGRARL